MISRRHMHLVIALLLPLMVLRAMLPAGYMPAAESGTLHIAMCSDGMYPAVATHVSEQPTGMPGDHKLPAGSSDCLFAHAAATAPPPAVSQFLVLVDFDAGAVPATAAPTRLAAIVRVQSARGPPSLSL